MTPTAIHDVRPMIANSTIDRINNGEVQSCN